VNISDSFDVFPLGVSKIGFIFELFELGLSFLKDFFDTSLEKLDLDFRNMDDFNVVENFLA
jgi:hypothetical protein